MVSSNLIASRLTLLFGPTGVGKSSLLNAAVVPHLRSLAAQDAEDGKPPYAVAVFRSWGDDPVADLIRGLKATLRSVAGVEPPRLDPAAPLGSALRTWTDSAGIDLLIILDQFEEYFLYHEGDHDRFATEFPDAVNDAHLRANFLVSFREDAMAKLDVFKGHIPRLFTNYLRLDHLSPEGAREAIEGPLREFSRLNPDNPVSIEPALVDKVLEQVETGKVVVGEAGAGSVQSATGGDAKPAIETSHLQMVMARLWAEEVSTGSRTLRVTTLDRMGGADEIIRSHLDRELAELSAPQQDIAAAAFKHLVTPSGTKIAHTETDLVILTDVEEVELAPVLQRLSSGGSRILRSVEPAPGGSETRYEIFHDVLAPAIVDWRARWVQQKQQAAAQEELGRQREEAEARARAARRRARNVSIFSLVLALLVVAVALVAVTSNQRDLARSRQEAADAIAQLSIDPTLSIRRALRALEIAYTPEADIALRRALAASHTQSLLAGHRDWVTTVAFEPSGTRLVTGSRDGTATVWEVPSGTAGAVLRGHQNAVTRALFDATGSTVATSSADGTARLWDATTGRERHVLIPPAPGHLLTVAFDGTGDAVVTGGTDGAVIVWDSSSGQPLRELDGLSGDVSAAAFDATGTRVVASSASGMVAVWDASGQQRARFNGHRGGVAGAVFSPDGSIVGTAGDDGEAYLWRWQTGEATPLPGHYDRVVTIAFDRAGDRVVTAGEKTARVWDARTGDLLARLRGHSDWLTAAVFSSDGRRVATASQDGSTRVWDIATEATVTELRGHQEIVWDVAFDPNNEEVMATAGSDRTARLWRLPAVVSLAHDGWVTDAEFSRDEHLVLTASNDGTVRVWDASGSRRSELAGHQGLAYANLSSNGDLVATIDDVRTRVWRTGGSQLLAETRDVQRGRVVFLPSVDGVLVADDDGTVYRWDWRSGVPPRPLTGYRGGLSLLDLDLSPDGTRIVTAGPDGVARVWDTTTGDEQRTLSGHQGVVYTARFSRDGRFIVTASADGSARVWDARTGNLIRSLVSDRGLSSAALNADGTRVVAGDVGGNIRIWDVRTGRTLSLFSRHTDLVGSVQFRADGHHVLSGSDDQTAALYACPTCEELGALRTRAERYLGTIDERQTSTVHVWALSTGNCYDFVGQGYASVLDCDVPHEREVFAVVHHPAAPGDAFDAERLKAYAREECEGERFVDYVGTQSAASSYRVDAFLPTADTWDRGDRRITCSLVTDTKTTGSARGTRR